MTNDMSSTSSSPSQSSSSSISCYNVVLKHVQSLVKLIETQEVALFSIPASDVNPSLVPFLQQTKQCNRKAKDMLSDILSSMPSLEEGCNSFGLAGSTTNSELKYSTYSLDGADVVPSRKTESPLPQRSIITLVDETSTKSTKSPQTKRTGSTSVLDRAADALSAFGFPPPSPTLTSPAEEEEEVELPSFSCPVVTPVVPSSSSSYSSSTATSPSQRQKAVTYYAPSSPSHVYRSSPLAHKQHKPGKSFSSFFLGKKSKKEEVKTIHPPQASLTADQPSPLRQPQRGEDANVAHVGRKNSKRRLLLTLTKTFTFGKDKRSSMKLSTAAVTISAQQEKGKEKVQVEEISNSPTARKEYAQLNQISMNLYAQKRDAIESSP